MKTLIAMSFGLLVLFNAKLSLASEFNGGILCAPINASPNFACLALDYLDQGTEGSSRGKVTVYTKGGKTFATPVSVELDGAGLTKAESMSRGFRAILDWSNYQATERGGEIDGLVSIFDARLAYQGRLSCGSNLDQYWVKRCGPK